MNLIATLLAAVSSFVLIAASIGPGTIVWSPAGSIPHKSSRNITCLSQVLKASRVNCSPPLWQSWPRRCSLPPAWRPARSS